MLLDRFSIQLMSAETPPSAFVEALLLDQLLTLSSCRPRDAVVLVGLMDASSAPTCFRIWRCAPGASTERRGPVGALSGLADFDELFAMPPRPLIAMPMARSPSLSFRALSCLVTAEPRERCFAPMAMIVFVVSCGDGMSYEAAVTA